MIRTKRNRSGLWVRLRGRHIFWDFFFRVINIKDNCSNNQPCLVYEGVFYHDRLFVIKLPLQVFRVGCAFWTQGIVVWTGGLHWFADSISGKKCWAVDFSSDHLLLKDWTNNPLLCTTSSQISFTPQSPSFKKYRFPFEIRINTNQVKKS